MRFELAKQGLVVSESAAYRALVSGMAQDGYDIPQIDER